MDINENTIIDVLKQCFDPEIPIDLWNLGLIYKVDISLKIRHLLLYSLTFALKIIWCDL